MTAALAAPIHRNRRLGVLSTCCVRAVAPACPMLRPQAHGIQGYNGMLTHQHEGTWRAARRAIAPAFTISAVKCAVPLRRSLVTHWPAQLPHCRSACAQCALHLTLLFCLVSVFLFVSQCSIPPCFITPCLFLAHCQARLPSYAGLLAAAAGWRDRPRSDLGA